jgi:trehalose/maltose transport system permease protein
VISRENLFDFDKFAYGSAQSTLLFAILAVFVSLYIWLGKVDLSGEGSK